MVMTYATISGRITQPGTDIGIRARVTATPMTTEQALKFPSEDRMTWGPQTTETNNQGVLGTLKIPLNPTPSGVLWRFEITPLDKIPGLPPSWVLRSTSETGLFEITTNARLEDLVDVDILTVTPELVQSVSDYAVAADAAADSATASATSATASATSATNSKNAAAASATAAGSSATTAQTAATTATGAASTAQTAATTATGAATTATGAASSAQAAATTAAASATSSAASASLADSFADSATVAATTAAASATSAAASADAAAAITEPLTAPANEVVAGFVETDGPTKTALSASTAAKIADEAASGVIDRRRELPYTQAATGLEHRPITVRYRPASVTNVLIDSAGANANVDATNLAVTITCPPSGRIRFRLEAGVIVNSGTALRWIIRRNGSSITSTETIVHNNLQAANTGVVRVSAEGEIAVDETGAALVPGKAYTFTWGHGGGAASKVAYTCMGGNAGAAVMTLEPVVPNYRDCGYTVASSGYGAAWPLWLCHDRKTILGASATPWRVRWSEDGGSTWQTPTVSPGFPQSIQQIRETDDGEVLAFIGQAVNTPAAVWKSSGWATNKATATFTKVLDMQGPDATVSGSMAWREFSVDAYGPVVLATEYGVSKAGPGNMARYVFLSEDYGATWRIIFDLADLLPETGVHTHAAVYDPWWDAIWLTTGDDPTATKGTHSRNMVSWDRGETWERIPGFVHQCTTIIAMPSCILFVTDKGDPNAIYRIPRTTRRSLRAELAYIISANTEIVNYGTSAFQLRTVPGAPVLFGLQTDVTAHPSRIVATYDGYEFKELWRDTSTYSHRGVLNVVGPLDDGKILAHVSRGDGTLNQRERFTLTPTV